MVTIRFKAKLVKIGTWTILGLPEGASAKLPSRGMVMVEGTINGAHFQAVLEPDGKSSHWFRVDKGMSGTVMVEMSPVDEWPEPKVPTDVKDALVAVPKANNLWKEITPMARWDWLRWIGATKQAETRKHRIEVACSKLKAGERRPCCFNRTQCTDPYVSSNGMLLEPTQMMGNKK